MARGELADTACSAMTASAVIGRDRAASSVPRDPRRSRQIDAGDPSFTYKIRESQEAWKLARKLKILLPLQAVDHKLDSAAFARSLEVRVPEVLCGPASLTELMPPADERFTLKPLHGTSAKGVLLLERTGSGFRDLLSGHAHASWSSVLGAAEAEAGQKRSPFYIEELLLPDARSNGFLDDFKFYSFYGEIGLILQKRRLNHHDSCYKWFDGAWRAVDTGRYLTRIDANLPEPSSKNELKAVAERLSSAIPVPFLRVDLYSTLEGVAFGEFTPHPGGFNSFSRTWDRTLGSLYEEAATRLQGDLVHRRFDLGAFWTLIGR